MFIYQPKNTLIHKVHPVTLILYIFIICLFSLTFSHPVFLLGLFIAISMVIISSEITKEWLAYLKFSIGFILIIMIVNSVLVRAGTTVLFWGPRIPGLGRIRVTLEALSYGGSMGLRFLVIISAFCLYTYVLHPDKVLKLMGRWGNKSVLALTLATRLFPLMVSDFRRITEVQRCRGVVFNGKNVWAKVKKYIPILNIMLLSSLERSFQLAETMQARGYGLTNRSYYTRELWRPRDLIIIILIFVSLLMGLWLTVKGFPTYNFYPRMEPIKFEEVILAGLFSILFVFPAFLNWGWKKWPLLKSKI